MKAAVLEDIERLAVREMPQPEPGEGEVRVRVKACAICGTDLRIYHYGHHRIRLPQVLGHEVAGIIDQVGAGVAGYTPGAPVTITPRIACGHCYYCRRGQYNYCQSGRSFGYQLPGGYAEYMIVPREGVSLGALVPIGGGLSFDEAALTEPLACCLRAQRTSGVGSGAVVAVIGGGPVGMLHCRLARARGASVILIEREPERLKMVSTAAIDKMVDPQRSAPRQEVQAFSEGRGADVVIVACSSAEAQVEALSLAGRGGRVNFFGGLPPGRSLITLDSNLIHYDEIQVQGSHGSTPEENREAAALLASGQLEVKDLITHSFPLEAIDEAFRFAESRQGMKVVIHP